MASTQYEVRADDDPTGMPLGTATMSTHGTAEDAFAAIEQEATDFEHDLVARGEPNSPLRSKYLPRLVVEVSESGERRVHPDNYEDGGWFTTIES